MTTREKFVERFGAIDAKILETAAYHHRNKDSDDPLIKLCELLEGGQPKQKPDMFLLDIATCISWACLTKFHKSHGFIASRDDLKEWIRDNAVPPDDYRDPSAKRLYSEYLKEEKSNEPS